MGFYKTKNVKQKSLEVDVKRKGGEKQNWIQYFLEIFHAETWGFMIRFDIPYFSDGWVEHHQLGLEWFLTPGGRKGF